MTKKLFCKHCNKKTKIISKWEKDSNYTYIKNLYCSKCNIFIKSSLSIDAQSYNILINEDE